ncbi:hypothetical protein EG328_006949 [Venturia inaequalis]|uniref:Uncharacterized protein n=1 Tax=Venturia inaequalis TaxID=5025 RepID=A0A8H3UGQ4_VENIN|nr:hypothetical protein EG328_006949 [Venturia inaequalis]KAE9992522.1 hypothetical protein EG327_008659 [Venturia inaequalis]RDI83677.1 hypothetical protein Vi05172_g6242 [Venturia inaequalis]
MCRYYMNRYNCGHSNRILELERDCFLVDANQNSYGCCEKEEHAKHAECDVASPFDCPGCRVSGSRMDDHVLVVDIKHRTQQAAAETEKKAKETEGKALERGRVWAKFRNKQRQAMRNLNSDWREKVDSPKQMAPAVTAGKGTAGDDVAAATKIQAEPEPEPERSAALAYGAVTILKRS